MDKTKLSLGSLCVHEGKNNHTTKPHQLPIYATSSFDFEKIEDGIDIFTGKQTGHVYSRYGNPTTDTVAAKLAAMESFNAETPAFGFLTSSGMSAISSVLWATLHLGDQILTQGNLYGGTTELLKKILEPKGIQSVFTNLLDLANVEKQLDAHPQVKVIYFETPANPTLDCVDIEGIACIARKRNILTIIDNTFCTPYLQRPLSMGVDVVIHSTTKFLNGHGNSISGAVISNVESLKKPIWETIKLTGTQASPWDAWLLNNGLKTLHVRMDRHCDNAMNLAVYLNQHDKVNYVNYGGLYEHPSHHIARKQMTRFGAMLSFEIKGSQKDALRFMNGCKMCSLAPTLGDVDTLLLHPATSSHLNVDPALRAENGISEGLIRVSVGIESIEDIIADIEQALDNI